jgi:hypothetical protein
VLIGVADAFFDLFEFETGEHAESDREDNRGLDQKPQEKFCGDIPFIKTGYTGTAGVERAYFHTGVS